MPGWHRRRAKANVVTAAEGLRGAVSGSGWRCRVWVRSLPRRAGRAVGPAAAPAGGRGVDDEPAWPTPRPRRRRLKAQKGQSCKRRIMRELGSAPYSSHLRPCSQVLARGRRDRPWVSLVRITDRTTSGLEQAGQREVLVRSPQPRSRLETAQATRLSQDYRRRQPSSGYVASASLAHRRAPKRERCRTRP